MDTDQTTYAIRELCRAIENLTFEIDRLRGEIDLMRRENDELKNTQKEQQFTLQPDPMVIDALNICSGKIEAIRLVRAFTNATLHEATDFVKKYTRHNITPTGW